MKLLWTLFTNAYNPKNAETIFHNTIKEISTNYSELIIAEYHEGGFTCSFSTPAPPGQWSETVLYSLAIAQNIATQWILTGEAKYELDIWSNDTFISGVNNIHLIVNSFSNN